MEKRSFTTIANNGESSNYSNTCFWISISDFLKYTKGINLDPDSIRKFSNFSGSNTEFFDFFNENHRESAQYLCNKLGIGIDFHYGNIQNVNNDLINAWLSPRITSINESLDDSNRCAIVAYGNHFEFVISETDKLHHKIIIDNEINKDSRTINYFEPTKENNSADNETNKTIEYFNNEIIFYQLLIDTCNTEIMLMFNESKKLTSDVVQLDEKNNLIKEKGSFFNDSISKMKQCERMAKSKGKLYFKYARTRTDLIEQKNIHDNFIKKIENSIKIKSDKIVELANNADSLKISIEEYEDAKKQCVEIIEVLKSNHQLN